MSRAPSRRRRQFGWPFPVLLAVRYLRATRRDAFVGLLSILATGGIALGVAALIMVLAGLSGLQDFLRRDVLARTPHLEVELADAGTSDPAMVGSVVDELRAIEGVRGVRPMLRGRGWVLVGGAAIAVRIVAFEGDLPDFFPGATGRREGLYMGSSQAAAWGIEPGDVVEVVSPRPTLSPFGPTPRLHRLPLEGTFTAGRTEQESERRIGLPLAMGRRLLGSRATRLEIRTASLENALAIAPDVARALPRGASVRTWKDLNRPLFFALRLEKSLMFASVFLIVPVAGMALITVLALLISSKRSEIGMLRAMGATAKELRTAFRWLGTLLGACGLILGAVVGVVGARLFDRFELLAPPGDVYFIDHIPFRVEMPDLALVLSAAALLTAISTLYGARRAAATEAVEALRP